MMHLSLLQASSNADERTFIVSLKNEAAGNSGKAYELSKWMLTTGSPQAAMDWLTTLPPTTRTNLPVPMVESDCYMALKQWTALQTNLAVQSWGELDCLRLACRARAYKEQGSSASAKTEWLAALKAAATRRELLLQLAQMSGLWNWPQEQEDVLWVLANRYPTDTPTILALSERLQITGKTRSLQNLYSLAFQNNKTNLAFMNNLAMTALLLESWEKKPHELAREVYTKNSTNASYVSTYAYSLLVQRKAEESLRTIEQLSPRQLERPSLAAYYGVILKANGQVEKAGKYLEIAAKARLLPEEKKLVDQARRM
jgi:hypothetical protein